jgi:hypothetical protein
MMIGLSDGRIVRWDGASDDYELFARTGEGLPECGAYEVNVIAALTRLSLAGKEAVIRSSDS